MDVGFIIEWIQTLVMSHFIFGGVLGLLAILHPEFERRSEQIGTKYKRTQVFLVTFFMGSLAIPLMFRKAMKQRAQLRKPVWSIFCRDEKIGSGMTYKEAKATVDVLISVKRLGGEECERVVVDFDKATITVIIEGDDC